MGVVTLQGHGGAAVTRRPSRIAWARRLVGGFYLVMGGLNAGLVVAEPGVYRTFADRSFWVFVRQGWPEIVMAEPRAWILLLAAGEVVLGALLLRGGRAARAGWCGTIAFHVLLMSFGFGIWLWSVPVLALLVPLARADWPALGRADPAPGVVPEEVVLATRPAPFARPHPATTLAGAGLLSGAVVLAALYGLLASAPYQSLPEETVRGARAQDAFSLVVAVVLVALAARGDLGIRGRLVRIGLLAYLCYSYLIYVTGVPMNRVFLAYVVIVALSAGGLAAGLHDLFVAPATGRAPHALRAGTGWLLVVTAVLFAGLWLSTLVPVAAGLGPPEPQGVGGTPYPVFWLDLALVLPAVGWVGVALLRGRPVADALAVVALVKILTLFAALWAGPVLALVTGEQLDLGPDAAPSLALLVVSAWLLVRWWAALGDHEGWVRHA